MIALAVVRLPWNATLSAGAGNHCWHTSSVVCFSHHGILTVIKHASHHAVCHHTFVFVDSSCFGWMMFGVVSWGVIAMLHTAQGLVESLGE